MRYSTHREVETRRCTARSVGGLDRSFSHLTFGKGIIMRRVFCLLVAAFSVAVGAAGANASTISFNNAFGPVGVPLALTPLAPLSLFDPSLGTLTQVELSLDADAFSGSIAWDNEAAIPTDVTLGIGAQVTITTTFGNSVIAVPLQLGSALGVAADNDGAADFVGTDSFSVVGGTGNDTDSAFLTAAIDLANYTGLGTFGIDVEALVQNFLSTTGGFGPIQQTAGVTSGTVSVTYTFTAVPEPSTALLFGGGLIAMAAGRRRR